MNEPATEITYKIWAVDNMVYGPIGLPVLIQWVQEERVLRDTWVHSEESNAWQAAIDIEPLRSHFSETETSLVRRHETIRRDAPRPDELRQCDVFAGMSDQDLVQFLRFGELVEPAPGEVIIKKGDPGDAVFFVLAGQVRARLVIARQDTTLCTIPTGEFFGEMAMFCQSSRTADIVVEANSRLLRLSSQAFLLLIKELPRIAAPVLFGIARNMAQRISEANRRVQRDVASEFLWR